MTESFTRGKSVLSKSGLDLFHSYICLMITDLLICEQCNCLYAKMLKQGKQQHLKIHISGHKSVHTAGSNGFCSKTFSATQPHIFQSIPSRHKENEVSTRIFSKWKTFLDMYCYLNTGYFHTDRMGSWTWSVLLRVESTSSVQSKEE